MKLTNQISVVMQPTASEQRWRIDNKGEGDEGGLNPGVVLTLAQGDRLKEVLQDRGLRDITRSWSPSEAIQGVIITEVSIRCTVRIQNLGLSGTVSARLYFVIWVDANGKCFSGRHISPTAFVVPAAAGYGNYGEVYTRVEIPLGGIEWEFDFDPSEFSTLSVTHVHCMVLDAPANGPGKPESDFWVQSKTGAVLRAHPQRLSSRMACWTPMSEKGAFSLNGKTLTHELSGCVEVAIEFINPNASWSWRFGQLGQPGWWFENVKHHPVGSILESRWLTKGQIALKMQVHEGGGEHSSEAGLCTITLADNGNIVRMNWEDGGGDSHDFTMLLIHR